MCGEQSLGRPLDTARCEMQWLLAPLECRICTRDNVRLRVTQPGEDTTASVLDKVGDNECPLKT